MNNETKPICCSFCKRSDGGPFAEVVADGGKSTTNMTICKRCCDERGIEVAWGPTHTATTTF